MIEPITPANFATALGIAFDSDGLPAWLGVTRLLRQAVGRWGMSRVGTLTLHSRRTLAACGYVGPDVTSRIRDAVDVLCLMGDAAGVWADAPPTVSAAFVDDSPNVPSLEGRFVAPTVPRVVEFGARVLIAGSSEIAAFETFGAGKDPCSAARWMQISEAQQAAFEASRFEACTIDDWLGPSGILDHLERREARGDGLEGLWPALNQAFEATAGAVEDPGGVSVLAGAAGGFMGRSSARDGRWRPGNDAPNGRWLGTARGYGERLKPVMLEVRDRIAVRMMELFDLDELRWALLSRGLNEGQREVVRKREGKLELTCPLPEEALRLRALCRFEGWWSWELPPWVDVHFLGDVMQRRYGLHVD